MQNSYLVFQIQKVNNYSWGALGLVVNKYEQVKSFPPSSARNPIWSMHARNAQRTGTMSIAILNLFLISEQCKIKGVSKSFFSVKFSEPIPSSFIVLWLGFKFVLECRDADSSHNRTHHTTLCNYSQPHKISTGCHGWSSVFISNRTPHYCCHSSCNTCTDKHNENNGPDWLQ